MSYKPQRINRPGLRLRNHRLENPNTKAISLTPVTNSSAAEPNDEEIIDAVQPAAASSSTTWGIILTFLTASIWLLGLAVGFQTALSIQMGLLLILAIVGLASPALGILAIGLLSAIDAMATEYLLMGGFLRFNTTNYILLIVMGLNLTVLLRLRDLNSRMLQLFLVLIALELSFSRNLSEGMQDVLNVATTFGIVVYFARSLKDSKALYWLGIVTGTSAALGGMVFFLQFEQLPYANPNNWTYFPVTALFAICISFYYAYTHNMSRVFLLLLAVVNFVWIFLSGSRGSLLIALISVIYLFLSTRSISKSSVMAAVAILIGLWLTTQFAEQEMYTISRIQLLFDPTKSESQRTSKRSLLLEAGLDLFTKNPMGIGTGSFREVADETAVLSRGRPAHSAWVKTLAENGIPGVLLLAAFVASFTISGIRSREQGSMLFGIFITLIFAVAFISKEFQGKSLWFLAAAGISLLHPQQMMEHLHRQVKQNDIDYRERLREVRFGRKR